MLIHGKPESFAGRENFRSAISAGRIKSLSTAHGSLKIYPIKNSKNGYFRQPSHPVCPRSFFYEKLEPAASEFVYWAMM
jgi:hypothetical protein